MIVSKRQIYVLDWQFLTRYSQVFPYGVTVDINQGGLYPAGLGGHTP